MNNILVVNVNWLGDVIFSIPVFRALKKKFPQARVTCLAVPRVKEVLEHCPFIDEVIVFDEDGSHGGPFGKLFLIFALRRKRFDAAFLIHRSMTRALLICLAGIPQRIGFDVKKQRLFLTRTVSSHGENIHRMDEYARILEGVDIPVEDRTYELQLAFHELQSINAKLFELGVTANDTLVVINAGGNWDLKRWPVKSFALLAARLVNDHHVKVLISGADKDVVLAQTIAHESGVNPLVWAGSTNLKELTALFKRADCVISNDTGPLHLAASVGTSVIAIFGPTRSEITGPRGRGRAIVLHQDIGCNKAPCYHLLCPNNECMQVILVEHVLKAFQKIQSS